MKIQHYVTIVVLAFLCLVSYWSGLSGPFLFDDYPNIIENDRLTNISELSADALKSAISQEEPGPIGRPISFASFALNIIFTGLNPFWFKLTNLLLHILAAFLLVALLHSLTSAVLPRSSNVLSPKIAIATAAVWLLHPFNLTSVLYVVQRMTELSALFSLLSMLLYTIARQRQIKGASGAALFYALLPISFALGLFSKENGILLPGYLLLLEVCFFRFRICNSKTSALLKRIYAVGVILSIPVAIYFFYYFGSYQNRDFTLTERLLSQSRVIFFYIYSILLPDIRGMAIFHDEFSLSHSLFEPLSTFFSITGIAFLLIAAVVVRKRAPVLSFGIFFYFMTHALESTFIALEMVHEHRNYLGSWGLLWVFFYYLFVFADYYRRQWSAVALSCVIIVCLAVSTGIRASYWSDERLLAEYHAYHHPKSYRSLISAGGAYAGYGSAMKDEVALRKAFDYYERAYQLRPQRSPPLIAMIGLLAALGEDDGYIEYETLLAENLTRNRIDAETMSAFVTVTRCLGATDNCTFPPEIYRMMAKKLLHNPYLNTVNSQTAAQIYSANSNIAFIEGDITQALVYSEKALGTHPQDLQHWLNQAMLLGVAGRLTEAMDMLVRAREIDPTTYGHERIDAVARQLSLGRR